MNFTKWFYSWIGPNFDIPLSSWEKVHKEEIDLHLKVDGDPIGVQWMGNVIIEENKITGKRRGFYEDRMGNYKEIENVESIIKE